MLGDHLAGMSDDEVLWVVLMSATGSSDEDPGCTPYVQFCAYSDDVIRGEVSSNEYLRHAYALTPAGAEQLAAMGWLPPTKPDAEAPDSCFPNWYVELQRHAGDELASMTVLALREVFGVIHPALLVARGSLGAEPVLGIAVAVEQSSREREEELATVPESPAHLQELVDTALKPVFGHLPSKDADGDIPVTVDSSVVYVRVDDTEPTVELFGIVVDGVRDLGAAAREVAILNRDSRFAKFVLQDRRILASLEICAQPFAPAHLRAMLSHSVELIDSIHGDLAARTSGCCTFESGGDVEREQHSEAMEDCESGLEAGADEADAVHSSGVELHPALMTIIQIDAEGTGDVSPELAASICDFDRDLILQLIRTSEEQSISWREDAQVARVDDDDDDADSCDHEARAWRSPRRHSEGRSGS